MNWFVVHEGLLFKFQLVIPRGQIVSLVNQEHVENGHFGAKKYLAWLQQFYYFPKMQERFRRIIAGCKLWQLSKISPRCAGKMHSIIPSSPNELVCTDMVGPLPMSRGGVTFLLVFVDVFTKHVVCAALKRATTKAIINVLVNGYIPNVGKPLYILSDNRTQYFSKLWVGKLRELDIKCVHASVYFPQGNPTERVNREIGRLLRTFCHNQHQNWAAMVKDVENYLNNVVHDSTSYTPNELHFGKSRANNFIKNINFPSSRQFETNFYVIVLARERLLSKDEKRRARHEQVKNIINFKPGDNVLVLNQERTSALNKEIKKLFLLYKGPYQAKRISGPNSYELCDVSGETGGIHNVVNLKKFVEPIEIL